MTNGYRCFGVTEKGRFCHHATCYALTHGVTHIRTLMKTSVSTCSEKGLVQNELANLFSHPKPQLRVFNQVSSQNAYFLLNFKPSTHWKCNEQVPVVILRNSEVGFKQPKGFLAQFRL